MVSVLRSPGVIITQIHTHRGIESFTTHVWMLKSLLEGSKSHLETLQLYVIAADFKKMLSRTNHPVSIHYLACLRLVKARTFAPTEEVATKPYDDNDQLFLDAIPFLANFVVTKIPNLKKMAEAAAENKPFNLYNKDTCIEFHELLCELLDQFFLALKELKDLEKSKVETRKKARKIGESDWEVIEALLLRVLFLGQALRAIVRGSSITAHLSTIAPFLQVKTGKSWPMDYESDSEDNAEFRLLKPYSTDDSGEPLLPWNSLHDWLRLMVHHFDAIHVLDNHITNLQMSTVNISIKILNPPLQDDKMLPWKELLKNEKYFPLIPNMLDQPSAADLITFLSSPSLPKDGDKVQTLIEEVVYVKKNLTSNDILHKDSPSFVTLTEVLDELKDTSSAGWKDYVEDISKKVNALMTDSDSSTTDSSITEGQLDVISDMLENLKGSFSLYKKLPSLCHGKCFGGSVHCEVLAALMNSLSGNPEKLSEELLESVEEFRVSHIPFFCSNVF
jgi:hypothetical protein